MNLRYFLVVGLLALFGASCFQPDRTSSFYVATDGNDSNPGTVAQPFLSLGQCQVAMRNSSTTKICVLRAGTYNLGAGLSFTSADDGETWQYYPTDGVNTAVVNGGGSLNVVTGTSVTNWTWNGIKIQNYYQWGIEIQSTSSTNANNNTIENSEITGNTFVSSTSGGGAVVLNGNIFNSFISHNYVHNIGDSAVQIFDGFSFAGNVNGLVIDSNVFLSTNQQVIPDGSTGVIYINFTGGSQPSTIPVQITNNFIRDWGNPSTQGAGNCIGYDTGGNHIVQKGNICGPPAYAGTAGPGASSGGSVVEVGGSDGHDNTWSNNIYDLGLSTYGPYTTAHLIYNDHILNNSMINNTVSCNIILSNYTGGLRSSVRAQYWQGGGPPWPGNGVLGLTIDNNYYWNYRPGGQIFTTGTIVGDSRPINQNPQISGYLYNIASSSPVFGPPCNITDFTKARSAGPPRFTIPSSSNHSD
jgi:hypothetical protein